MNLSISKREEKVNLSFFEIVKIKSLRFMV